MEKIGRNDLCPCGSGKKYKNCCLSKKGKGATRKLTAKWLNAPSMPNLIERSYGNAIAATGKNFIPLKENVEQKEEKLDN